MEENPIPYNDNPNYLPIPPLDEAHLLSDDFFVSGDGDFPFNVDFDFTFDDLTFADDLLLEQPQNPNSSSGISDDLEVGDSEVVPRVYDCSSSSPEQEVLVANQCPVSSEESNFGNSRNSGSNSGVSQTIHGGDSSGNNSDRDVSSRSLSDNDHDVKSHKINGEQIGVVNVNGVSKRKKENDDHGETSSEAKGISKLRRSLMAESNVVVEGDEGDDKKRARLMRNRESAQLSRQRKKQYVEELEDKVRAMHSTITDLNGKISYMMAENASLRQQLAGVGVGGGGVPPPPHGMYPMAPMPYPWMGCPPYMVKPQGSHVPLLPIPRLKTQQPAAAPKVGKKSDGKKTGGKTKKVASVSLLGMLFFMLLFGGLVPLVNVKYGGIGSGFDGVHKGGVFMVDQQDGISDSMVSSSSRSHGRIIQQSNCSDGFDSNGNSSKPMVASLYVPRNDKLVQIDGNLIIHSVLATDKAVASKTAEAVKSSEETGLAIHGGYPPYPIPRPGSNNWRHPHLDRNQNGRQRALGSDDYYKSAGSDGELQQWFREGLAGPMLSSGMCTEVFQFDVSPTPGAIVPSASVANITSKQRQNSTRPNKPRNRRILHEHSIHRLNASEEHVPHEKNDGLQRNTSSSSMVVSVLVDPREVGDVDGEGVIRSKTLSRIFVVVLIDSVKYVTYSCMLPFMGSGNHLVTT